jgi:hypothetical protein
MAALRPTLSLATSHFYGDIKTHPIRVDITMPEGKRTVMRQPPDRTTRLEQRYTTQNNDKGANIMKKTRMQIIILVMVAFILLPVSVCGQNITNSTVVPIVTGTGMEPQVTTQVPIETTIIPVTNATIVLSTNTTSLPGTTTETVSGTTATTPVPTPSPATQLSTGNITIASSPLGASILIDGVYYGITPGNLTGILAGNHIVRLTMSGYFDYEGTIYVVPGQVTNVFGTLPPLSGAASPSSQPVTSVPVTTTAPAATVQPTQTSSGGIFESPAVIAGVIGIITACIGAGATIFTHISKTKKE